MAGKRISLQVLAILLVMLTSLGRHGKDQWLAPRNYLSGQGALAGAPADPVWTGSAGAFEENIGQFPERV
ncbi:MAG: hypothetical protein KDH89_01615, partial [Anaerolineae bacterium]|nr:hypothetical protein [Anaerolineae bacterium]